MNTEDYGHASHEQLQEMPLTASQARLQIILQIPEIENITKKIEFQILLRNIG